MINTQELAGLISGDVETTEEALTAASHDASLFEVRPQAVVHPKNVEDIKKLINYATAHPGMHLTARAAGTDMSGGPLSDSVVVSFTKYFKNVKEVVEKPQPAIKGVEISGYAVTEPG